MSDRMKDLTGSEVQQIHDASMRILEKIGVCFNSHEASELFRHYGYKFKGSNVLITEEDVMGTKPAIPKLGEEEVIIEMEDEITPVVVQSEFTEEQAPHPVASVAQQGVSLFLVFGLAGFIFGMIALLVVIVLLVSLLRSQHQATIQHYLASQGHYKRQN